jgi:lipoyl(octanoyl) transferase
MSTPRRATCLWLGRRRYDAVLALQKELHAQRRAGEIGDVILLLEHDPVVTLGRSAAESNVLLTGPLLKQRGVDLVKTGRGGDVTYHGPGQLVGYPILDLRPDRMDVRKYVRALAEVMILLASEHGVEAGPVDGMIGVWADAADPGRWAGEAWAQRMVKIGAIGVRLSRWVTMHGFALNLCTDLDAFSLIVPCGISEHAVASVASLTETQPQVADVAMQAAPILARALAWQVDPVIDHAARDLDQITAVLG